ncbi:TPM domain-containing protein [Lusitaniella coriacea LEGE 07157]|uniref:TPM domain-containing protein n=1 Tax=Lusitaniella coriacea LEGE 07157 TaxID=945747 RepID=A0A8J7IUL5_9CYAN|nr:TPM domain-containing protein [Lusitaniella coriacea]MBE9116608.1 TPM domain-containing protein [Lusitaniella coriacea LEGE 07157]
MRQGIRRWGFICLLCCAIALFPPISHAVTVQEVPNPRESYGGWVTDMADILLNDTEDRLNRIISELEAKNGTEMAVVTVRETAPSPTPKAFATELFNTWGIGKKGENNGVLFLISKGDRRVEIETGYGIAEILPDVRVANIIETEIVPRFKQKDFDGGAIAGTEELATILAGESPLSQQFDADIEPRFGSRAIWNFWSQIFAAIAGVNFIFAWYFLRRRNPLPPFGESRFNLSLNRHSYLLLYLCMTFAIASVLLYFMAQMQYPLPFILKSFGAVFLLSGIELARTQKEWLPLLLMLVFLSIVGMAIFPLSFPLLIGLCGAILPTNLLTFLAKRYLRKRYACNDCEHPLKKVAKKELEPHLTPAKKAARKRGSTTFEGWKCTHCYPPDAQQGLSVVAYILNHSRFHECPTCKELTVTQKTQRILRPTSMSYGKKLRTDECHCCDYQKEVELLIPKKIRISRQLSRTWRTRSWGSGSGSSSSGYSCSSGYSGGSSCSSSGGGSSFGGGESGGGGAGGDW